MIVVAVVAGLAVGAATILIAWGIRPPLARLDREVALVLSADEAVAGTPWQRWRDQLMSHTPDDIVPDLLLTGRSTAEFATARLAWTAGTAAGTTFIAGVAGVSLGLLPLVTVAGAATGWYLALADVRSAAAKRRRTFALALAGWTQMAAMLIQAGLGVEQAMRTAARAGSHWTFDLLDTAMSRSLDQRLPVWQTLADLAEDTNVDELRTLAAELRLVDRMGSTPAEALATRSQTLRDDELSEQLATAKKNEVKQSAPLVLLAICLILFIIYPAVSTFLGT